MAISQKRPQHNNKPQPTWNLQAHKVKALETIQGLHGKENLMEMGRRQVKDRSQCEGLLMRGTEEEDKRKGFICEIGGSSEIFFTIFVLKNSFLHELHFYVPVISKLY